MTQHEIVYHYGDPEPHQNDAMFFAGMGCVATVIYEGFAVDVYCDGATNATLLNKDGEVISHLYEKSDFVAVGLDTDTALDMAVEQNILNVANNSWFDFYCDGENLELNVEYHLQEALRIAIDFVRQRRHEELNMMMDLDTVTK